MSTKKITNFSGTNFFKTSQTFLGTNLAKTQALAVPEDKSIKKFIIFCWIILFSLLTVLGVIFYKLPKEVPLFYSKAWGKEQLVKPYFLFLPLLLSITFLFLNSYLASKTEDSIFLKKVLILGAGASTLLAVITLSRILMLLNF